MTLPLAKNAPPGLIEHEASPVPIAFAAAVLFGLSMAFNPAVHLLRLTPLRLAYRACVRWIKPG
ncbi:MAG TPA: hypothetical protein VHZ97_22950 [Pseudonocardiaceae bacterium]|jgi:hypothetical protein|nr:hypothetical protein [Pseudonocardiaceae bacterium]